MLIQGRISKKFKDLKNRNKKAFITFVTAGDPNYNISLKILKELPAAGADIIEIGMPFTDPMADGPGIQASYLRAISSGQTLNYTMKLVKEFRRFNSNTPIILMGYYNPIYCYGINKFLKQSKDIGIDGLLVVDLPPEVDSELCVPAKGFGIDFIRLATPTTTKERLPIILNNSSGFLYYVSVAGITGSKTPKINEIKNKISFIKNNTELPIAVGFGIRTSEQVKNIARISDGVVVGSAIVDKIAEGVKKEYESNFLVENTIKFVKNLSSVLK